MVEELESGGADSGDDMGGNGSESDASSQRPTLSECSSQEECAAGALMAMVKILKSQ